MATGPPSKKGMGHYEQEKEKGDGERVKVDERLRKRPETVSFLPYFY